MSAVLASAQSSTVAFALAHNQRGATESKALRMARANAQRLNYIPGTAAYASFVAGCVEGDCKDMERKLSAPAPQHGFFVLPNVVLGRLTVEVHFSLDSEGDLDAIEVWLGSSDVWPLMSESAEEDVRRQIFRALPDLQRQRDRDEGEDRAEARRWEMSPCA